MKVRPRVTRWSLVAAAILLLPVVATAAGQGDTSNDPEIRFARGLLRMGYREFAQEQLVRTRERDYVPENVRRDASMYLGRIQKEIGDEKGRGGDYIGKHESYQDAYESFGDYLRRAQDKVLKEVYFEVAYERGQLCNEMGRDMLNSMKRTSAADEAKDYKEKGIIWFDRAVKHLAAAAKFYRELRDAMDKDTEDRNLTIEEKEIFYNLRVKTGQILMEQGKSLYSSAELYEGEGGDEQVRTDRLAKALVVFEEVAEYYRLFDVRYVAYRYMGMCLRGQGKFDESEQALKMALGLQPTPENVWIIRLARYHLCQTYNAASKWDEAIVSAVALWSDLDRWLQLGFKDEEYPDVLDMWLAARIELGTAYVGKSKKLIAQAKVDAEKGNDVLEREHTIEAKKIYTLALDMARDAADTPESKWSRNAQAMLKTWADESKIVFPPNGITLKPGVSTLMAKARKFYKDAKYRKALPAFEEAILAMRGKEIVYIRNFLPEAWYQMGVCHYKLSGTQYTGGTYTYYYEAATCFSHVADLFNRWDHVSDAAFYAQQLKGVLFDHARALHEAKLLDWEGLVFEGERYLTALERMSSFGTDPRSMEMAFQAAEMARTLEDYEKASFLYSGVKQESRHYYQAKYLAGLSLYLEALKTYENAVRTDEEKLDRTKEISGETKKRLANLLLDAVALYSDYTSWFDNYQDRLGKKQRAAANTWVAHTKISYGKMLIHDVWSKVRDKNEGAEQALHVLGAGEGEVVFEREHLVGPGTAELRDKLLPEALMVVIQSYRRLDKLDEAEEFVRTMMEKYPDQKDLIFQATAMVGYAYLAKRRDLEEQKAPDAEIRVAADKAASLLKEAVKRAPKPTLALYTDLAAELYRMEEYKQAADFIRGGLNLEGFRPARTGLLKDDQIFALILLEDTYLKLEEWKNVEGCAERLLDHEKLWNEPKPMRERQKNIDYRMDLATALQEQGKCKEAADWWREVKSIAEKLAPGAIPGVDPQDMKFKATLRLSSSYACADDKDRGFRVLGWYLLSSASWLRDVSWAKQVEEAMDADYADKWPDVGDYIMTLIDGDVTLLRKETSRDVILDLAKKHFADKLPDIEKKIKAGPSDLGTGK